MFCRKLMVVPGVAMARERVPAMSAPVSYQYPGTSVILKVTSLLLSSLARARSLAPYISPDISPAANNTREYFMEPPYTKLSSVRKDDNSKKHAQKDSLGAVCSTSFRWPLFAVCNQIRTLTYSRLLRCQLPSIVR